MLQQAERPGAKKKVPRQSEWMAPTGRLMRPCFGRFFVSLCMSQTIPFYRAAVASLLIYSSLGCYFEAMACSISWRDPEEIQRQSDAVILAKVISKSEGKPSFRGVDYEYQVEVLRIERGTVPLGRLAIAFEDLRMHRRGETVVCPIKNGTGIEDRLNPGEQYRLFLKLGEPPTLVLANREDEQSG